MLNMVNKLKSWFEAGTFLSFKFEAKKDQKHSRPYKNLTFYGHVEQHSFMEGFVTAVGFYAYSTYIY